MTQIPFIKMHGLGNDFVVIDSLNGTFRGELTTQDAIKICDRRFGIGADQILWLRRPQDSTADVRMEILNADGSIAEMCGNGIRAVALYINDQKKDSYRIETLAGIKTVQVQGSQVTVDMGPPGLPGDAKTGEILKVHGREVRFHEVSMGNPHAVIFLEEGSRLSVEEFGPAIEKHARFPKRTNVEFVRVSGPSSIDVQVWERGAGVTLACGTGACASAVASLATGRVTGEVQVNLPGGSLWIAWNGANQSVRMKGPAVEVFRGVLDLA